jgi:hypothetical protein
MELGILRSESFNLGIIVLRFKVEEKGKMVLRGVKGLFIAERYS